MVRVGVAAAVLLGLALLGLNEVGYPVEKVAADPNAVAGQAWWTGAVSQLGLIGWGIVIAGFAGGAWLRRAAGAPRNEWRFCAFTALLFAGVAVDDALMLHESALSRTNEGAQAGILGIWAVAGGLWAAVYRHELLTRPLMLAALGGLATSLLLDVSDILSPTTGDALEEYSKYLSLTLLVLASAGELGAAAPFARPASAAREAARCADGADIAAPAPGRKGPNGGGHAHPS